ncbi:1916_t:CDS:2 [Rhizophagus irregularis]|nr:1916_t:CDS:2 [Rhizophagus irregularis]
MKVMKKVKEPSPPSEIFMPLSERKSNCKYGLRDAYETEEKSISTCFFKIISRGRPSSDDVREHFEKVTEVDGRGRKNTSSKV